MLSPERAYCLSRLGRLEEALEVARGGAGSMEGGNRARALRHLEAQVDIILLLLHTTVGAIILEVRASGWPSYSSNFGEISVSHVSVSIAC